MAAPGQQQQLLAPGLLDRILSALARTHEPRTPPNERREAQQFLIGLESSEQTHDIAFQLLQMTLTDTQTSQYKPAVQHFAFQLLQKAIKAFYLSKWTENERVLVKQFLLTQVSPEKIQPMKFVLTKYASCLVEIAKRQEWPELFDASGNSSYSLLNCGTGATVNAANSASPQVNKDPNTAVLVLRLLAESVGDGVMPVKDLPVKRKKELQNSLKERGKMMFQWMQAFPNISNQEKILFIKAFTPILGLAYLLSQKFDDALISILEKSDDDKEREEVILTFAEWSVTPLYAKTKGGGGGNSSNNAGQQQQQPTVIQKDDVRRLCENLNKLCSSMTQQVHAQQNSSNFVQQEDMLAQHRQIVTIVKDFVLTNAESLNKEFLHEQGNANNPSTQPKSNPISILWRALLLHSARYPSYFIASEAFLALKTLAKPWKDLSENMTSFLKLDEIVEVCLLRMWKPPVMDQQNVNSVGQTQNSSQKLHPLIAKCLQSATGSEIQALQWLQVLQQSKQIEQELLDYSANSEFGMLKNCVYLFLQTLSEVGGEKFFVPLVGKVRELVRLILTNEGADQVVETAVKIPALEASLGFLTRLTPYLIAKMTKEMKASKKHLEEGRQQRAAPPTYPNLVADPGNCVDNVLSLINELVAYENTMLVEQQQSRLHQQPAYEGGEQNQPPWLKLETVRLEFVGQVSTIYPVRPQVVVPVMDYLFQRIEAQIATSTAQNSMGIAANTTTTGPISAAEQASLVQMELQRKALTCLTTICKNGQNAVLVHLDTLMTKAQKVHSSLTKNNQQLLTQALVAAASSDFRKQREIVTLASSGTVQDWTSGKIARICCNEENLLRNALLPQREAAAVSQKGGSASSSGASIPEKHTHKSLYFQDAKLVSQALQSYLMILKHTSANISPYILKADTAADNGQGQPVQQQQQSTTADGDEAQKPNAFVVQRNPAGELVRQILPNLFQLLKSFFHAYPSDWLLTNQAFVEQTEWLMIMGSEKTHGSTEPTTSSTTVEQGTNVGESGADQASSSASSSASRQCYDQNPNCRRDDYDREAGIWLFNIRFSAIRTLGACAEAADGFWSSTSGTGQTQHLNEQNVLSFIQELCSLINETFPKSSPHHVELFYKHVFLSMFAHTENGKQKLLQNELCRLICQSELIPTLVRQTVAVFERYWHLIQHQQDPTGKNSTCNPANSMLQAFPSFEPVVVTSLLSLTRTVASAWTRLVVCGFGGGHSSVFVDYSTRVEARPFSWVDFLFRGGSNTTTTLLQGILFLLKIPDPEGQNRFGALLRIFLVQLWSTGSLHCLLHEKQLLQAITNAAGGSSAVVQRPLLSSPPNAGGNSTLVQNSDLLNRYGTPTFGGATSATSTTASSPATLATSNTPLKAGLTNQQQQSAIENMFLTSGGNAEEILPIPELLEKLNLQLQFPDVIVMVTKAVLELLFTETNLSSVMNILLGKKIQTYKSEQLVNGKKQRSPFVSNLAHILFTLLQAVAKEYELQCRVLQLNSQENSLEHNLEQGRTLNPITVCRSGFSVFTGPQQQQQQPQQVTLTNFQSVLQVAQILQQGLEKILEVKRQQKAMSLATGFRQESEENSLDVNASGSDLALRALKAVLGQEIRLQMAEEKNITANSGSGAIAQFELDVVEARKAVLRDILATLC
ncbi:unnamed protein product [Amoebophrya sp. A120]|nr:unnamed protein product [Amoebophrya sp. A120]|eukprot:GSA120T00010375001.1